MFFSTVPREQQCRQNMRQVSELSTPCCASASQCGTCSEVSLRGRLQSRARLFNVAAIVESSVHLPKHYTSHQKSSLRSSAMSHPCPLRTSSRSWILRSSTRTPRVLSLASASDPRAHRGRIITPWLCYVCFSAIGSMPCIPHVCCLPDVLDPLCSSHANSVPPLGIRLSVFMRTLFSDTARAAAFSVGLVLRFCTSTRYHGNAAALHCAVM